MPARADIVFFSTDKRPVLVVEVKDTQLYPTAREAAALRRNLMAHGLLPAGRFFMLATPVQVFIWPDDAAIGALPPYSASATSILDVYGAPKVNAGRGRGGALEIVIFLWLSDLAAGARKPVKTSEVDQIVVESGLYDQILGGSADFEVGL